MDVYYALKLGPVTSNSLNVLNKEDDYLNYPESELNLLNKININGRNTRIIRETNIGLLSKNEINSLDFVIDIFQGKPILAISHEYPEWKRYKTLFDAQQTSTKKYIWKISSLIPYLASLRYYNFILGKTRFMKMKNIWKKQNNFILRVIINGSKKIYIYILKKTAKLLIFIYHQSISMTFFSSH